MTVATQIEIVRYVEDRDKELLTTLLHNADDADVLRMGFSGADEKSLLVADKQDQVGFTARVNGHAVGFAWAAYRPWSARASLQQCFVAKPYRGHGVAGALVDRRLAFIDQRWPIRNGVFALTFENRAMESILISRGFELRGTWRDWIVAGDRLFDESLWVRP